jgi:hypothetical protein
MIVWKKYWLIYIMNVVLPGTNASQPPITFYVIIMSRALRAPQRTGRIVREASLYAKAVLNNKSLNMIFKHLRMPQIIYWFEYSMNTIDKYVPCVILHVTLLFLQGSNNSWSIINA